MAVAVNPDVQALADTVREWLLDEWCPVDSDSVNGGIVALDWLVQRISELEAALTVYANPQHWGIERETFTYPRAVWIGPGADHSYPDAPGTARAALADGTEGT